MKKSKHVPYNATAITTSIVATTLLVQSMFLSAAEREEANNSVASVQLPVISVDARLWQERSSEVPGSVDVINQGQLGAGVEDSVDVLSKKVSNIVIEESSAQTRVVIRGNASIDLGLQDPVGYFVNDIALPLGGNQIPDIAGFDTITVLKGPQGSTYGRNTEAGAIKLTTEDPSWKLKRWVNFSSGAIDGADGWTPSNRLAIGSSSMLMEDILAGSIAVSVEQAQGPNFNRFNSDDNGGEIKRWGIQAGVNYLHSDDTEITLKSVVEQKDQQRTRFRYQNGAFKTDRFVTNSNTNGFDDSQTAIHSLRLDHSFGDYELVSITGVTDYERDFAIDLDASPASLPATQLALENTMLSQEIRLYSDGDDKAFKWLAGVYVYDEKSDIDFSISPFFMTSNRVTRIDQAGWAGFGQVEYSVLPRLDLALGLRVERIEQDGQQNFRSQFGGRQYDADINETEILPKLTLAYDLAKSQRVFFSIAKGYLPGGYNYSSSGNRQTFTYAPQYSTNYELGWKGSFAQNRLTSTVAAFHTQIDDKQVIDIVPGGLQRISNAAEAEVSGLEWSLQTLLGRSFSAFTTLAWQDAETTSYTGSVFRNGQFSTLDLSGNKLTLAADYTYSLGLAYGQERTSGFQGQLSLRGSSDYYFDSQNTLKQSSYTLVDVEFGYRFSSMLLSLWVNNIFDEITISRAVNTPSGVVVEDSNPRTVGLQLVSEW